VIVMTCDASFARRGANAALSPQPETAIDRMRERTAITRVARQTDAIRQLLESDAVCQDIARYLVQHTEAADTARGIADWWVNRDISATERALVKLLDLGVMRLYLAHGPACVYAYTTDAGLRTVVSRVVQPIAGPITPYSSSGDALSVSQKDRPASA
jgi:hypothetical protein